MSEKTTNNLLIIPSLTVEDVNRVLEVGRMLLSVLTEEEIEELQEILSRKIADQNIGNTGVT